MSVELPGFKKQTREGIVLRVQDRLRIDFELEPGDVTESVVVTGEAPLVQSETSSLGEVVDARQIVGLPLNGRNYIDLATLTSGVIRTAEGSNGNVNATFVVNGTRGGQNNYLLDGIDNNSNDGGEAALYTNVDALEEFKVQTSNYSAEFGRSGGAVINASLKSGANTVSGSAFYFLRDESLDARGYFEDPNSEKVPFRFQQFGGTLGGPIQKDKTFFFVDYQATRRHSVDTEVNPGIFSVPTAAQRHGDFSGEGNNVIYDPLTGEPFPGQRDPGRPFRSPRGELRQPLSRSEPGRAQEQLPGQPRFDELHQPGRPPAGPPVLRQRSRLPALVAHEEHAVRRAAASWPRERRRLRHRRLGVQDLGRGAGLHPRLLQQHGQRAARGVQPCQGGGRNHRRWSEGAAARADGARRRRTTPRWPASRSSIPRATATSATPSSSRRIPSPRSCRSPTRCRWSAAATA